MKNNIIEFKIPSKFEPYNDIGIALNKFASARGAFERLKNHKESVGLYHKLKDIKYSLQIICKELEEQYKREKGYTSND